MFMILMLAGDRMSCVWKGMRIRDLLGNALHVFSRLARKHVLRLIASPLSWVPHSGRSHSFSAPLTHHLSFLQKWVWGAGEELGMLDGPHGEWQQPGHCILVPRAFLLTLCSQVEKALSFPHCYCMRNDYIPPWFSVTCALTFPHLFTCPVHHYDAPKAMG